MRPDINFMSGKPIDAIVGMSEGNPGALSVLMQLLKGGIEGMLDVMHLDDMNMRGPQIWIAFKEWANEDIDALRTALRNRDAAMVAAVNAHNGHDGSELAVQFGGSKRGR